MANKSTCRYCNHISARPDGRYWCHKREKYIEYHKVKWNRRCSLYELNPIDVLGENLRGYVPKEEYIPRKKKNT